MDEEPGFGSRKVPRPLQVNLVRDELPQLATGPVAAATRQRRRVALGVLLLLSFLTVAWLAAPVWLGIVFGALMAFSAQPLYRWMTVGLGERRRLSAFLTTLATGTLGGLLGSAALYASSRELVDAALVLQQKFDSASLPTLMGARAVRWAERLGLSEAELERHIGDELGRAVEYATQAAGLVLQTTTTAVVSLGVGCITMYYVLLEWPRIPVRLEKVLPLDPEHTRALVLEFRDIGRSALLGTMTTAVVQGVLGSIGFAILHVPHPITWGLMTALSSFVPVAGTAIVWAPMSFYYLTEGEIAVAVALLAWGSFLVVGIGDYMLRPWLVGRQGKVRPLFMLVSALGGMQVFGLPGIVVGPVLVSLFLAILRIYEREMESTEGEGARLGESPDA